MVIAGAGGHALEVLDLLIQNGCAKEEIYFFDDTFNEKYKLFDYFPILKDLDSLKIVFKNDPKFCLGTGSPRIRKLLYNKMISCGGYHQSLVSKHALISSYILDLDGVDIFPYAFISAKVSIGTGTLVNTRANVHHEVKIGEFCEISPSSNILGKVNIGSYTSVGSNSTILPDLNIGKNIVIGAGAVVTKNFDKNLVIAGVPAKIYNI